MRFTMSCILIVSCLNCLFADFICPDYEMGWVCDVPNCPGDNYDDQSKGCEECKKREEQEEENNRIRYEVYREALDIDDPDGAPHSYEEAEKFEKSIQSK
ncbi:MAG: hypothetical protein SP1CHLAM42_13170 [Chlamydiales bacterium]|nr:hypothetical protein [Chlamydiales bacterium]